MHPGRGVVAKGDVPIRVVQYLLIREDLLGSRFSENLVSQFRYERSLVLSRQNQVRRSSLI